MNRRLGCLSPIGILVAILAVVALATITFVWGPILFSAGPLNASPGAAPLGGVGTHAELTRKCAACHPAPGTSQTMADRCVTCHQDIDAQRRDNTGLHGRLAAANGNIPCRSCHPEHRGSTAPLTVIDPVTFPHDVTGYSLRGHQDTREGATVTCVGCHGQDPLRFDQAACVTCHSDLDVAFMQQHVAAFGQQCLSCHDGVDRYGPGFDHNTAPFPLAGRHADVPCGQCHTSAVTVLALQQTPRACVACHAQDDRHQGRLGQQCEDCHKPTNWQDAAFDHARSIFPLTGAHAQVTCAQCHKT